MAKNAGETKGTCDTQNARLPQLSRRALLGATAAMGLGGLTASLTGCAGPIRSRPDPEFLRTPVAAQPGHTVLGWSKGGSFDDACRRMVDRAGGLPWLSRGDSVLIKVACNSPHDHPAVTSPEAVEALARLLRDRGAGRVVVGDQAGVEHVRLTANSHEGSTRKVMAENGLAEATQRAGAELACFDERGWDGYRWVEADFDNHWGGGAWVARIVDEVDHVIYLPRIGSHSLSGATLGSKISIGWLRDDSRLHLHQLADSFFEQYAEVNHLLPIRERLRLVLTMGRSALLDIGPDFGTVVDLEAIVSVASPGLLEHDALASALLLWLDNRHSSFFDGFQPYPAEADFFNRQLVLQTWGAEAGRDYRHLIAGPLGRGLAFDRSLARLATLRGERPARIVVERDGPDVPEALLATLRAEPDGLFAV